MNSEKLKSQNGNTFVIILIMMFLSTIITLTVYQNIKKETSISNTNIETYEGSNSVDAAWAAVRSWLKNFPDEALALLTQFHQDPDKKPIKLPIIDFIDIEGNTYDIFLKDLDISKSPFELEVNVVINKTDGFQESHTGIFALKGAETFQAESYFDAGDYGVTQSLFLAKSNAAVTCANTPTLTFQGDVWTPNFICGSANANISIKGNYIQSQSDNVTLNSSLTIEKNSVINSQLQNIYGNLEVKQNAWFRNTLGRMQPGSRMKFYRDTYFEKSAPSIMSGATFESLEDMLYHDSLYVNGSFRNTGRLYGLNGITEFRVNISQINDFYSNSTVKFISSNSNINGDVYFLKPVILDDHSQINFLSKYYATDLATLTLVDNSQLTTQNSLISRSNIISYNSHLTVKENLTAFAVVNVSSVINVMGSTTTGTLPEINMPGVSDWTENLAQVPELLNLDTLSTSPSILYKNIELKASQNGINTGYRNAVLNAHLTSYAALHAKLAEKTSTSYSATTFSSTDLNKMYLYLSKDTAFHNGFLYVDLSGITAFASSPGQLEGRFVFALMQDSPFWASTGVWNGKLEVNGKWPTSSETSVSVFYLNYESGLLNFSMGNSSAYEGGRCRCLFISDSANAALSFGNQQPSLQSDSIIGSVYLLGSNNQLNFDDSKLVIKYDSNLISQSLSSGFFTDNSGNLISSTDTSTIISLLGNFLDPVLKGKFQNKTNQDSSSQSSPLILVKPQILKTYPIPNGSLDSLLNARATIEVIYPPGGCSSVSYQSEFLDLTVAGNNFIELSVQCGAAVGKRKFLIQVQNTP